ncbi:PTR2-domain-containing protein [Rhodofomes roseus]|uniref:PTR2-domain-containing protein n=1 Tax=Rhodofomes roseus TaxID=34475 RepID=A0ABQ8KKD6_9APHY|nr:PTR2-domain-containing protein [Rhodofomes roseus]KAH9837953.1 PTR2-domain-containing protein [Rhodofomes roseus]
MSSDLEVRWPNFQLSHRVSKLFRSFTGNGATVYSYYELRSFDEDSEVPTDEERVSLRRVADAVPWNAFLIAFVELGERFSYYGTTVVFTNFIQQPLPPGSRTGAGYADGQSGALGLGQRTSTAIGMLNTFWVYFMPLFGAYIADTRWGRFKTICVAVGIALVGHAILVVAALPGVIENTQLSLTYFIVALVIMGVGTGGFKSNISPLVAEQYQKTKLTVTTIASGERVIVDPAMTTARIYMYFYLFINIGALLGQIGMTYSEKYVGFWLAFLLPTLVFLLCPLVLFLGRNRYVCSPPSGSILGTVVHTFRFCMHGKWSFNPVTTYRHMTTHTFWDRARPANVSPTKRPEWMNYDDAWVDEVIRGVQACKVFLWYPVFYLTLNQLNNNLISQAATMETYGVPNDIMSNLDPLSLIILIPLFDVIVYPLLRRRRVRLTPLRKITAGFFVASLGMGYTAFIQYRIYATNPCGRYAATCVDETGARVTSNMNVWVQAGSYILISISEVLASVTGLEYAYTKAPKGMRSLVMAVFMFMSAIASAVGEAFVALSADPLLVWNYMILSALSAVAGVLFWRQFRDLDAREDELNSIGDDEVASSPSLAVQD